MADADPIQVPDDPAMPALARAIDLPTAERAIAERIGQPLRLHAARLIRHKPGRRFLLRYEAELDGGAVCWIGKGRARGVDHRSFELQRQLFAGAFADNAADGIDVPRPIASVPELGLWLQAEVAGRVLTDLLETDRGPALCERAAQAVHKLHHAGITTTRSHTVADELKILHQRLPQVGQMHPGLDKAIDELLSRCDAIGNALERVESAGIHRDFYPSQLLIDGDRIHLIDLDLFCAGDPMLDMGNFLGHLTEHSLRHHDNPKRLSECEAYVIQWVADRHGDSSRRRLAVWKFLSLVRHIHISTLFPDRARITERILLICLDASRELSG